jgi:hypothetical protein
VHVDEAWRHIQVRAVYLSYRLGLAQITDGGDLVADDSDIRESIRVPGSVYLPILPVLAKKCVKSLTLAPTGFILM